jgi:hypothetical protein
MFEVVSITTCELLVAVGGLDEGLDEGLEADLPIDPCGLLRMQR